jgi:hypothetical protein
VGEPTAVNIRNDENERDGARNGTDHCGGECDDDSYFIINTHKK